MARRSGGPERAPRADVGAGVARNDAGELAIDGIPVSELQRQFGTPLFVMSENDFRARARAFRDAFDDAFADICGGVDVYYAGKSFLCTAVVRLGGRRRPAPGHLPPAGNSPSRPAPASRAPTSPCTATTSPTPRSTVRWT